MYGLHPRRNNCMCVPACGGVFWERRGTVHLPLYKENFSIFKPSHACCTSVVLVLDFPLTDCRPKISNADSPAWIAMILGSSFFFSEITWMLNSLYCICICIYVSCKKVSLEQPSVLFSSFRRTIYKYAYSERTNGTASWYVGSTFDIMHYCGLPALVHKTNITTSWGSRVPYKSFAEYIELMLLV